VGPGDNKAKDVQKGHHIINLFSELEVIIPVEIFLPCSDRATTGRPPACIPCPTVITTAHSPECWDAPELILIVSP
jgi:hypothetical protein